MILTTNLRLRSNQEIYFKRIPSTAQLRSAIAKCLNLKKSLHQRRGVNLDLGYNCRGPRQSTFDEECGLVMPSMVGAASELSRFNVAFDERIISLALNRPAANQSLTMSR